MAIYYATEETFDNLIQDEVTIVDFFSTTCGPCKVFSRVLEEIDAELPFMNIVKVNITECPELGARFHVSAVPTIHFYKSGVMVEEQLGIIPTEDLKEKLGTLLY